MSKPVSRIPIRPAALASLLALSLALLLAAAPATRPAEPKAILFFGNSFTIGARDENTVPMLVARLAEADGHPRPAIEQALSPGKTLEWHLANHADRIGVPEDVEIDHWDAVVLQELSIRPTEIGDPARFQADASALVEKVRAHSPNAVPVLFETWARGPGNEDFYPDRFPEPAEMQAQLRANYEAAAESIDGARLARVGDNFEAAEFDRSLYAQDIYHASHRGTLLVAMTIYATIYDEDVGDIDLSEILAGLDLKASEAAELVVIVDASPGAVERHR